MKPSPREISDYLSALQVILTRFANAFLYIQFLGKAPLEHAADDMKDLMESSTAAASQGIGVSQDYDPGVLGGEASKYVGKVCEHLKGLMPDAKSETKQMASMHATTDMRRLEEVLQKIGEAKKIWDQV